MSEVGVGAVLKQRDCASEEGFLDRGEERSDTFSVGAVRVGAKEKKQANSLGIAVRHGFLERQVFGASVGRDTLIQKLLDALVVLTANSTNEGGLEVRGIAASSVSWAPSGHAEGIGLESGDLGGIEVEADKRLKGGPAVGQGSVMRTSLMGLVKGAHAIERLGGSRGISLVRVY